MSTALGSECESPGPKPSLRARLTKRTPEAGAVARRIGERLGAIANHGARLARLEVNHVQLRRRLDERYRALGRAVYQARKHTRGKSPFDSLPAVESELSALETPSPTTG